jgi:hypothetical protein
LAITITNIFYCKTLQNLPKFLGLKLNRLATLMWRRLLGDKVLQETKRFGDEQQLSFALRLNETLRNQVHRIGCPGGG